MEMKGKRTAAPGFAQEIESSENPPFSDEGAGGGIGQTNDFIEPATRYPLLDQGGRIFVRHFLCKAAPGLGVGV
jgi:hypothetical protein